MQIWHVGRVSHPVFLDGALPLSASVTQMQARVRRSAGLNYGKSREATLADIERLLQNFADAAGRAIAAGFDGVEIHAANGYLIDQFLHYHTNLRQDAYGKDPQGMSRFALQVVTACGERVGYDRVGIRLSPGAYLHEMQGDTRDAAVFAYFLSELASLNLAYVHTGNFDDSVQFTELGEKTMTQFIREHYQGQVIASGGYDLARAAQGISANQFDLVSMGKPFIANPDLVHKLKHDHELTAYDSSMLETLN